MRAEIYASVCCGATFVPGFGHDNIVEADGEKFYDVVREGYCPSCGARKPEMMQIWPDKSGADKIAGSDNGRSP